MTENEIIVSLLLLKGIGNKTVFKLYEKFGNFKKVEEYFINENYNKTISNNRNAVFNEAFEKNIGKKYLEILKNKGGKFINFFEDDYPNKLKNIYNPPIFLQYIGNLKKLNGKEKIVAIVGSRKATEYGKRIAYDVAYNLSKNGLIIVSGLAYGIDAEAHKGTIDGGGFPIGVIGNGLDQVYPKENYNLYNSIKEKGLLITEEFLFTKPLPHKFPLRNRIISGLCDVLLVVEANEKSGSLITVEYALDHGKTIFAVPGNIYSSRSIGCNKLIKEGAYPLTSYKDILAGLGLDDKLKGNIENIKSKFSNFNSDEIKILSIFKGQESLSIEKIFEIADMDMKLVISTLSRLELKGVLKNIGINEYFIKNIH